MSKKEKPELTKKQECLSLQIDKSTQTKKKICYYLELSKNEREKHHFSKNELLLLRKRQYDLTINSKQCILNKTKTCLKDCRQTNDENEIEVNCRNKCKIDEKKLCIQFEDRKNSSLTLRTKIQKRPWENYSKCAAQFHLCYCNNLNKLDENKQSRIKLNRTGLSDGKPLPYQEGITIKLNNKNELPGLAFQHFKLNTSSLNGQFLKTFQIQYNFPLSLTARNLMTSFTNKYIYYALDDISYLLDSNINERNNLLAVLYSCMIALHNDFSINFFDIWIDSIYFNSKSQINRFLTNKSKFFNQNIETTITLKLHYFTRMPIKKPQSIW